MSRGRHKIFLGMAAGVGKTYRMLQEGQAELASGRDVVIGYLEPHERPETSAQAEGLEVVPRLPARDGEVEREEMDLAGILARAPELCLVDELAHTNAPWVANEKRFEDVEEIVAAGIDVYSSLNIQHLESLNDRVFELTQVRVRETIPDAVVAKADEVILIDLTPEALIARLREGKIYPSESIPAALNNFFRIENLRTLREVALREAAEDVGRERLAGVPAGRMHDRLVEASAPQAVGERMLALVKLHPRSHRIARRAWRSAQRLGADLDLLTVRPPAREASPDEREQLESLRRLASILGVQLLVEEADDVAEAAAKVAREREITYLLIGAPTVRRGMARLREPLHDRLLRLLPGVDLRIVADRSNRHCQEGER